MIKKRALVSYHSLNSAIFGYHSVNFKILNVFCSNSQSPFPQPMAHRAVPISISIALGHASASAVKATTGGWSTGSSASLTFPLHSHIEARREGFEYHF